MIKVILLGTNGWYDTPTGNTESILIQSERHDIILDAGNGITKIGKYLSFNKPVHLFLSHFHLDHIIGFHALNNFYFKKGLNILGPKGLKKIISVFVQKPFTYTFEKLPYKTAVYELAEGKHNIGLPFECRLLTHPVTTLGYRFNLDKKIITYCTDTGYCENAVKLAESSDLFISECAYKKGQEIAAWPHLNPEDAARLAKTAKAKKLILTHFDASNYKTFRERRQAEKQAKAIFPNVKAAVDEMLIKL